MMEFEGDFDFSVERKKMMEMRHLLETQGSLSSVTQEMSEKDVWNLLLCALEHCYTDVVTELVKHVSNVSSTTLDKYGTLLHAVVRKCYTEHFVEDLLNRGIDVNAKSVTGDTALHHAVCFNAASCVQVLLSRPDIDVNSKNKRGETPLCCVANYFCEEENDLNMQALMDRGADLNVADDLGRVAIHHAAGNIANRSRPLELLLARGADINAVDAENKTPLIIALIAHNEYCVKTLLERGANVNIRDNQGKTVFHYAVNPGFRCCSLLRCDDDLLLVHFGADVHARDNFGKTALHYPAWNTPSAIAYLHENGVDIDARDSSSRTPLFVAAEDGDLNAMETLLRFGADVNLVCNGDTPFTCAIKRVLSENTVTGRTCLLLLRTHVLLLKLLKFPVHQKNLDSIVWKWSCVQKLLAELESDVEKCKRVAVDGISLYKIISDRKANLPLNIWNCITSWESYTLSELESQIRHYPAIWNVVAVRLRETERKLLVRKSAYVLWREVFVMLPVTCVEQIASHLCNEDLKKIFWAWD